VNHKQHGDSSWFIPNRADCVPASLSCFVYAVRTDKAALVLEDQRHQLQRDSYVFPLIPSVLRLVPFVLHYVDTYCIPKMAQYQPQPVVEFTKNALWIENCLIEECVGNKLSAKMKKMRNAASSVIRISSCFQIDQGLEISGRRLSIMLVRLRTNHLEDLLLLVGAMLQGRNRIRRGQTVSIQSTK